MKNTALLFTSTQNDLLHPKGRAWGMVADTVTRGNVIAHLKALGTAARLRGIPVLHSPVVIDYDAMPASFEPVTVVQKVIVDGRLHAAASWGAEFLQGLEPQQGDIVLAPRTGFSSFWANDIDVRLKAMGVKTLYLAGMLAHACIESHARDAAENGYKPVVVRDAVGAAGDELLQASLAILGLHAHAVRTTEQTLADWRIE